MPPSAGLVVALDGPASSGKSSVGAAAAERLGYRFCDTGLLYRAVTWLALKRGIAETDAAGLAALVAEVELIPDGAGRLAHVSVDGADVTDEVHGPEVDAGVSAVSRVPELRAALLQRQRAIAAQGRIIMAGRDIGTVVLPDADLKLFLDASVEERAQRRAGERGIDRNTLEATEILAQLRRRDEMDSTRPVAPLRAAPDAVHLRTDGNALETTVGFVVEAIRGAEAARGAEATGAPGAAPRPSRPGAPTVRARARAVARTPIATTVGPVIRIGSFVMRCVTRLFTRVDIEGELAAFPRQGAVLIAANHASNADPVLIGGFLNARLGRPINWMGKREVFEWPIVSWLARHGGVHPVDRGSADVEAFRTAMRILDGGNILAVFPEGTRSPDGRLQAAKDGTAVLAGRSGATIVPIGLGESDRLWPKGHGFPRRTPHVTVRIGVPFTLAEALAAASASAAAPAAAPAGGVAAPAGAPAGGVAAPAGGAADGTVGASRHRSNAVATDLIMRRIAELLPPRQRGAYGDEPAG